MTFSIIGHCPETGMFGVAISSSSPAVAARCSFARAGVGAVATQNITDPRLGPHALDLMERGASPSEALSILERSGAHMAYRQVLAVGRTGETAIYSGAEVLGSWSEAERPDVAAAGNLLADAGVPEVMVQSFANDAGPLGARLLGALRAGLEAGGEAGPVHSAGLLLVDAQSWPLAELRIDWTEDCPVAALEAAYTVYEPQMAAYVMRALDPRSAPSYGVPGDE
ncbi:DUF1028 domain-containing protein [Pelagibacterium halotolerans]|uniref:Major pilin protein fimA n=1 Tax=Pelagibacterium halotolerans (strain DSM 22347 / JCM 15775 / CGMCC 1.7692 / B2) TaxID=1082931 RepID=G4RCF7_PELHB|nr:DUF1028 domain-containing protein [Pelagibacterium halotolerans]AEQ53751.1 hypothetical protein KKY_3769 [Pelagibacterium halotolerans B2]QJR20088.1 DUF1028 domain-containing protein [Pelagibacterium halotolerans]SEA80222.1 Uncharacterized conserved protein, Ntn-hydrolase superfamily [Pelagibacterium halotolerans]